MSEPVTPRPIDTFIRILLLGGLLLWCVLILAPFGSILLWGAILAVAVQPLCGWLAKRMGGRTGWAATILVLIGVSAVVVPGYIVGESIVASASDIRSHISADDLHVPQLPAEWYADSGIRRMIADRWPKSDGAVAQFVGDHTDQLRAALTWVLVTLGGFFGDLVKMLLSVIVMGLFLANARKGGEALERFLGRAIGARGPDMVALAEKTIRNVAKGILGVAVIQTVMFAAGVFIAGVPGAGLLSVAALLLAMVQIGVGPLGIGVIIYAWATMGVLPATLLTIWMLVCMVSDNVLKPLLLGRGASVPMAVIFLGAIGGFILSGFIGLFTGAVVLSIGYEMLQDWVGPGLNAERAE